MTVIYLRISERYYRLMIILVAIKIFKNKTIVSDQQKNAIINNIGYIFENRQSLK
jgi:hypothetical protein